MRTYGSRLFIFFAFVLTAWSMYGQGIKPGDVFQHSDIDSVDLKDLNGVIHIPLFSLPQRGTTKAMTFSISANTQIWTPWKECNANPECDYQYQASQPVYPYPDIFPNPTVGPRLVNDSQFAISAYIDVYSTTNACAYYDLHNATCVPYFDPQGAIYEGQYIVDSTGATHTLMYDANDYTHLRTVDGSGYMVKYPNGSQPYNVYAHGPIGPPAVYDRSGRTSAIAATSPTDWQFINADIDNNSITETATAWIDTVGRTIAKPVLSTDVSKCASMPAGTPAADYSMSLYQPGISKPFVICYAPVTVHTRFWPGSNGEDIHTEGCLPTQNGGECPDNFQQLWFEIKDSLGDAMQSVTRPDGTAWRFYYDNANLADPTSIGYGTISRITFPTGGSLSYCYTLGMPPFVMSEFTFIDPITQSTGRTPLISRRIVDPDGGSINCRSGASTLGPHAAEWDYSNYSSSNPPTPPADGFSDLALSNTATVLATKINLPDGNYQVYSFVEQAIATVAPLADRVLIDTYDTHVTGTPRVRRDLQDNLVEPLPRNNFLPFGRPISFVATPSHHAVWLDGIQTENSTRALIPLFSSIQIICGDPTNPNGLVRGCITQSTTGSFSLGISTSRTDGPRSTTTQYKWLNNAQTDPSASAYQAANLIGAVQSQTVTENGSSATTTFVYDESGFVPAGAHIGHLTGVTRVNNSGPSPTTHTAWNTYGMVDHSVDAKGATVFTNSAWDGIHLFPTVVTSPLGQESFSHDSNTGALLSYTDLNSETTTYTYDTAGRPLTVHNPDLSGTGTYSVAACYPDANTQIVYQAQTTSLLSPSQDGATCPSPAADTVVTKVKADGLARITDNILVSAPEGAIDTTTTYDVLGRVATVSNPYRSTADPTYGVTQDQYDTLGRVRQVTKQDGSFSTVSYAGNCITSTDEAGKQRKACTDLLGRLTNVWEDPAGLNYETDYQYDALGNLLRVDQKGSAPSDSSKWRTRLFTYNSLSQLLTAYNPESGTICYGVWSSGNCVNGYDANGNLINKTDARGITTSYSYDNLNRVTLRTHSDGTAGDYFAYDSGGGWGIPQTNAVGRLTEVWKGSSCCAAIATIFSYDAMGRVIMNNQCLPSNCGTSNYALSAIYDLAGDLASLTYPSGRTITNSFNSAGRLNKVQFTQWTQPGAATLTPYTYWSALDSNFYPNGVPKSVTLGSGVTETTTLSQRLQLQEGAIAHPSIRTFADHFYNYGPQNNGNIASVTDNLSATYTQSFTYDALNRLATANESRWGMSYVYDAWGNYLQQNQTAGTTFQHQYTVGTNNRLSGYTYDPAGNLLNDGFHQYAYDAESRITQVDSSGATYTYDAEGERVRKDAPDASTEYIYFGGQVIAEKNTSTGDWTDYVFADGKRIAQAFSYENRIRAYGTANCTSCGTESATYQFAGAGGLNGYAIRSGDTLAVRQTEIGPANVGIILTFSDGSSSTALSLPDQDGQLLGSDGMGLGSWHSRTVNLTPAQGKTISQISLAAHPTGAGTWSGYFNDLALFSADGTVHPVFSQQSSVSLSPQATGGISGAGYEVNHDIWAGPYYFSVHYYHDDQIGSSRLMTGAEGWPIWGGTFLPYGEEYNPQITTNHYKFTGKERDSESGLDYFGARYYSNGLGRFTSVDPRPALSFQQAGGEKSMAKFQKMLSNPQTWNMYAYCLDNPLRFIDPSGETVIANEQQANDEIAKRKLQEQRAQLTNYAKDLAKQVGAGKLDANKALDMFYNKAAELTKNTSDALLIAVGSSLDIRHATMDLNGSQRNVGNVLTANSLGIDSLHHFAFAAFNTYDNWWAPAAGVANYLVGLEDGPPYSRADGSNADVIADVAGAYFGQDLSKNTPNPLQPSAKIPFGKQWLNELEHPVEKQGGVVK